MYDVVIIGSGPAGLTASIYTIRASLKTIVVSGYKWGGQLMLTTLVENFPGFPHGIDGPLLMQNMRAQAENLGVKFIDRDAKSIEVDKKPFKVFLEGSDEVLEGKSLIIATGEDTKWLDIPGEKELIGRGVSTCAPCDAFFFKNRNVAVVGGGDSAMEEALLLARVAASVTIIHRSPTFRASKIMQERVLSHPKIKVVWNTVVKEILGEDKVIGLKLVTQTILPEITTESPENIAVKEWELPIDGVFVAIGHKPNSQLFVGKIDTDEKGYIKRQEVFEDNKLKYHSATNIEGVFVAGDVNDYKYRQAITASAYGCMAAMDAEAWLMDLK